MTTSTLTFDPRIAIAGFISVVIWISTVDSLATSLIWLSAAFLTLTLATIRHDRALLWRAFLSALVAASLILVLFLLFDPAHGGSPIQIGPLKTSSGSLFAGMRMAARLMSLVLVATLFLAHVDALRLSAGVTKLLMPLRHVGVPVLNVFYFSYFLIAMTPLLVDESRVIRMAQRSRGWNTGSGLWTRLRSTNALILPTLSAGLRRGDQIAMALSARGFSPDIVPSIIKRLRLGMRDWISLAILAGGWVLWGLV